MNQLEQEYRRIANRHWEAERYFFARVVLPASVVRVFYADTKPQLMNALVNTDIDALGTARNQIQFKRYFEVQLSRIARVINRTNKGNARVYPGYKWGHGTKILCLFFRDMVLHSHYFSDDVSSRLSQYLYTPIDNIVMRRLKGLGYELPFRSIKEIDSAKKFYVVQEALGRAAAPNKIPRVWFDDNWGRRV